MIWKGSLVFGRIAIPVGLVPAFVDGGLHLRNLCREHEAPVSAPRWCDQHERALEPEEIVKAHEIAPGQFVLVEDEELEAVAPDAGARAIEIGAFLEPGELEPLLQGGRSYLLAPAPQELMRRAYGLLSAAMRETGTIALARFVAWRAEHVCTVERRRGADKELVLRVLRFPEDLEDSLELDGLLVGTEPADKERKLACQLIRNLSRPFAELDLVDHDRERLRALVEAKLAGREIVRADAAARTAPIASADLAAALRESVEATTPKRKAAAQAARSKRRTSSRS